MANRQKRSNPVTHTDHPSRQAKKLETNTNVNRKRKISSQTNRHSTTINKEPTPQNTSDNNDSYPVLIRSILSFVIYAIPNIAWPIIPMIFDDGLEKKYMYMIGGITAFVSFCFFIWLNEAKRNKETSKEVNSTLWERLGKKAETERDKLKKENDSIKGKCGKLQAERNKLKDELQKLYDEMGHLKNSMNESRTEIRVLREKSNIHEKTLECIAIADKILQHLCRALNNPGDEINIADAKKCILFSLKFFSVLATKENAKTPKCGLIVPYKGKDGVLVPLIVYHPREDEYVSRKEFTNNDFSGLLLHEFEMRVGNSREIDSSDLVVYHPDVRHQTHEKVRVDLTKAKGFSSILGNVVYYHRPAMDGDKFGEYVIHGAINIDCEDIDGIDYEFYTHPDIQDCKKLAFRSLNIILNEIKINPDLFARFL